MTQKKSIPSVSVNYASNGSSTRANEMGMRVMQERAYEKRGEQYLLIKSPPASGKSRALMFVALDKLHNQGLKKAIIVVPEKTHIVAIMNIGLKQTIVMPCVSSESRGFLPVGLIDSHSTVTNLAFALNDAPLWNMSIIASSLHVTLIATVCGQLETRLRYSNTLGWKIFPIPSLTEKNKADLTRCAEDILLAREAHFTATIADLYDPENMPKNLRHAYERNDEVLERIYIGRRFKNDTERLEKLFDLYTKMTAKPTVASLRKAKG
jgi:hypothetical protein